MLTGPPRGFVAIEVQLAMVDAADWDRVFVADLATKRARLRESNVMRFGCCATAEETWLRGDELAMLLVAQADGFRCSPTTLDNEGRLPRER
jgi:hypothetical protein